MMTHINEFNGIVSQVINQKLAMDDEFKAAFLLCTLPDSWDTFRTSLSNSSAMLTYPDIEGALLQEEMNRKNNTVSKSGALNTRGRSQQRGRSKERKGNKSRSSSRDITCYYCGKKGHLKKQCYKFKNDKKKGKVTESKGSSEDVNVSKVVDSEDELLVVSSNDTQVLKHTEKSCMHDWIIDSGASFHVTPFRELFCRFTAGRHGVVFLGNDHACHIIGIGDIQLVLSNGSQLMLSDVRYIPDIRQNLISTGQLDDDGYRTIFGDCQWRISKGALVIAKGPKVSTLYHLHANVSLHPKLNATELPTIEMWHSRLGHMSRGGMEQLSRSGYLPALTFSSLRHCEHCIYGRQIMLPHKKILGKKEA